MNIAYKSDDEIFLVADKFLRTYHPSFSLPIPIEEIAELTLKISIFPVPNLRRIFGHESFINGQFNQITIDNEIFEFEERTRFTVAHEIGHLLLHRELYEKHNMASIDEFLTFQNSFTPQQWQRIHIQADRFAGFILLPKHQLDEILEREIRSVGGLNKFTVTDYKNLVELLKQTFFVSETCIQTKLTLHYNKIFKTALSIPF